MKNLSASRMGILDDCLAPMRPEPQFDWRDVPIGKRGKPLAQKGYTREGTGLALASDHLAHGIPLDELPWRTLAQAANLAPAMLETVKKKTTMLAAWRAKYNLEGGRAEVAFARGAVSGGVYEVRGRADGYLDVGDLQPCGTIDLLAWWRHRGRLIPYVIEMKSGFQFQPAPAEHAQARTCSWLAARALGFDTVACTVLRLETAQYFELPQVAPHVFDAFDLDVIEAGIDDTIAALRADREREADPRPGPHCAEKFCPSRYSCAAGMAWKAERKAG